VRIGLIWVRIGISDGFSEYDNETSGFVEGGKSIFHLRGYLLSRIPFSGITFLKTVLKRRVKDITSGLLEPTEAKPW
jgi:hypothetical protein